MGIERAGRSGWRTVQRSLAMLIGIGVLLAATACWPQAATPPAVVEASISPSPVVAGSTFTLTLTATSTSEWDIGDIALMAVRNPSGGYLPGTASCLQGWAPYSPPAQEKTVAWTCTIPEGAPNGTWLAQTRVYVEGLANRDLDVPFEVTGGSNDTEGPQAGFTIPPTVSRGTSFSFTVRASDEHPSDFFHRNDVVVFDQNAPVVPDRFICTGAWTPVDATTSDFTSTCEVPAGQSPGEYHTYGLHLYDAFGQESMLDITTTVV